MSDIAMIFEEQKEENKNKIICRMFVESGCNPLDGEYYLYMVSSSLPIDICSHGGVDDISLVKEVIENEISAWIIPKECCIEIYLKESGEWDDVFWNKYYIIEKYEIDDFGATHERS